MIEVTGRTHVGRRKLNEDRFVADVNWGVALVADGMGGPAAGEVAADIVATSMVDLLDEGVALADAVAQAHGEVKRAARDGRGKPGMGSTLVVALFEGHAYQIAWVGDSRAYLWNDGELRRITRDHSKVEDLLARGEIGLEEARQRGDKNLITRAMGLEELAAEDVPVIHGTLARGQQLLLCSDGLNDALPGAEIAQVLAAGKAVPEALDELVERALQAGGSDNITVVIVSAGESAPSPEAAVMPAAVTIESEDGSAQYFPPDGESASLR